MPSVSMKGISKYYGASSILANDCADLLVRDGEIHAIVGENGAGKSTLMKILYGLERPDSGRINLGGREVHVRSPAEAALLGIGMVQQHAEIVDEFSAAENVVLCAEPRRFGFVLDRRAARARFAGLAADNGFSLDPDALGSGLSVGERQELEILKLLYRKAQVLVLDEPTAVLAEEEVFSLFATLRRLAASGRTIIIITHKVREVRAIADSVTVMRHGKTLSRLAAGDVGEEELATLMMGGQSFAPALRTPRRPRPEDVSVVFEAQDLRYVLRGAARPAVDGVSFSLRRGEVLGICALAGNGLAELEDLATGFRRPSSGRVLLDGRRLPRRRGKAIGYVPQDRLRRGASLHSSVQENLAALDRDAFFPHGIRSVHRMVSFAEAAIRGYDIAATPEQRLGSLSGGSIQKVILARELNGNADFLVFSNPTWGLDIASTEFVYERILAARERGAAILLVSSSLDEVLALSDRVGVMSRGRLAGIEENGPTLDRAHLGKAMLGAGHAVDSRRAHAGRGLAMGRKP